MKQLYDDCENIVGVKDATANLARVSLQRHAMGPDFIQLSGEDATALGFMAHGGHGCISVTANVAPKLCAEFQSACLAGDYAAALTLQDRLMPLASRAVSGTEPGPDEIRAVAARAHAGGRAVAHRDRRPGDPPGGRGRVAPCRPAELSRAAMAKKADPGRKIVAENRKARYSFAIGETFRGGHPACGHRSEEPARAQGDDRRILRQPGKAAKSG